MFKFKANNLQERSKKYYGKKNNLSTDDGDKLFISFMIQTAKCETEQKVSDFCDNHHNDLFIFKKDDDIAQPFGMDVISKNATLSYYLQNFNILKTLCDDAGREGFKAHEAKKCKMKISLNKGDLLTDKLSRKIDLFVANNYDFFKKMSRREKNNYRIANDKMHFDLGLGEENNAITFNKNTVVLNFFRSTLNSNTIMATICMCHGLVYFLNGILFDDLYDHNQNVFNNYVEYIKNNYPFVKEYIEIRERMSA